MKTPSSWVLGYHAVSAVLARNPERALNLLVVPKPNNDVQNSLLLQAENFGIAIHRVDKQNLSRRVGSEQHQGIALEARSKQEGDEHQLVELIGQISEREDSSNALLLILDQVQDPHNFGACLRTADAAGVDAVIVGKDNSCPVTSVVQKVASGAAETVSLFRVTNLARSIDAIKELGIWVLGTSDKADVSLYSQDLTLPTAIVMGAEGQGLRKLTEQKCDALVKLPMAGSIVSSLNVSVATGVCLFEAVRQRQRK